MTTMEVEKLPDWLPSCRIPVKEGGLSKALRRRYVRFGGFRDARGLLDQKVVPPTLTAVVAKQSIRDKERWPVAC